MEPEASLQQTASSMEQGFRIRDMFILPAARCQLKVPWRAVVPSDLFGLAEPCTKEKDPLPPQVLRLRVC